MPPVPIQFHKYIDPEHSFKILDCTPTREIEVTNNSYRVAKFYQNKSHRIIEEYYIRVPESIFFKIKLSQGFERILITKQCCNKLYIAGTLFDEAMLAGHRVTKYITLYKTYECLTKPSERDIYFSSIRHSLSHSVTSLTKTRVINTLFELYGGLEIDLSQFKHRKVFYIYFWRLLIEVDRLLYQEIERLLPRSKELFLGLKIIY